LLVHFLVAAFTLAIAAHGIHDDRSSGFAANRIKSNLAAFQLESAVNRVQSRAHRKFHFRLHRIERDQPLLSMQCRDEARIACKYE